VKAKNKERQERKRDPRTTENAGGKGVCPNFQVFGHTSKSHDNLRLLVHRWFRYSVGFSAEFFQRALREAAILR